MLLVGTVHRVGWSEVGRSITGLGWWYAVVVALGGVRFAARARAWQLCAANRVLRFPHVLRAVLAGDALGNLTPLGLLASEPAKVVLVTDRVSGVEAVSSVAAENAFYIASVLTMIGAGALVFVSLVELPAALQRGVQAVLALVLAGVVTGIWIARRQPAVVSRLARLVAAWTGRAAAAPERLREVELHVYAPLRWPPARIAHVMLWEALFHLVAVAEVLLVLRLLPGGASATLLDAFVLETAGRLIIVGFKFVPYRLGIDEAGTAVVARALGIDPALGVAVALVRRVRVLAWNLVGLALLLSAPRERAAGREVHLAPDE